ncbi:MAG: c-type cytochrome, partial [Chitinophagaceae bacterium]
MKKTIFTSILIMVAGFLLIGMTSGFSDFQGKKPWNVPDAAKSKKNTVASDASSIAAGKALWSTHCKSCHGAKGLGDGSKAAQLDTEPGDFSKASF